jgi:rhodanese-related sulfurtransferase
MKRVCRKLTKHLPSNEQRTTKDSPVIVQCRSGKRSTKAASTLQAAGFTQVYNLTGGIIAWADDGLKTAQSKL